jgi:pimeloyl-ACP methyl ester carboxylesterase
MVLVHGLGGSAVNWHLVKDRLGEDHHVYAIDLVGFGRTEPGPRSTTVQANANLLNRFIEEIIGEPAVIVGNSMGGLVAKVAAADRPDLCSALVLVAPAVPAVSKASFSPTTLRRVVVPALPGVGAAALRRYWENTSIEQQLQEGWELLASDPSRIDSDYLDLSREIMERRRDTEWAADAFSQAARSIGLLLARRGAHRRIIHRIASPTLLIQGDEDRIVIPEAALRLIDERPDWDVVVLEGVGHVPMIETPDLFLDALLPWVTDHT